MTQVAHLEYAVERNPETFTDEWSVTFGGEHFGHFHTQKEALDAALSDAGRVARLGHDTRVLVHRRDGGISAVWTYDQDRQAMVRVGGEPHEGTPDGAAH